MPRRLLAVLSVCAVAALTVTAVAFAHGGGGNSDHHGTKSHKRTTTHAKHTGQPTDFLAAGLLGPAVKACRTHGVRKGSATVAARKAGAACRTQDFKSGAAKLKAAAKTKPDLAALKTDLAASLASKLGKTPDEVLTAVRAELDARLTQAVQAGFLTQKGHDLALACFDDPASCDLNALKAEVRWPGHRDDDASATTPGDTSTTTPGDTTMMHPGGRSTSAPLR
jgi:hypothetical protein